ncbi:MAG: AbrB/MazE/SpoVT family DNA-binding domain-containing protein [Thaumarchaeota archaeon]|nr:AbrB/MazE/SpoVT family DNA-binding domain-containing protein [Nitrososphaerota archaeon]
MTLEPEVTTISEKGQVVIPQSLRKELGIKPRTKFLVFGRGDIVIMKRLELPDVEKEWEGIFRMMDEKGLKLSEKEILEEVTASRSEGRRRSK